MVRKIGIVLGSLILVGLTVTAVADPPVKTDVWHCGCVNYDDPWATVALEWQELNISSKSKGHQHHYDGQVEVCSYWDPYYLTCYQPWERDWDDCQEVAAPNLTGVEDCSATEPSQGALCGHPVGPPDCEGPL